MYLVTRDCGHSVRCQNPKARGNFFCEFTLWLKGFKELSKLTVELPLTEWLLEHPRQSQIFDALMNRIARQIGIKGQLKESLYSDRPKYQNWAWEATPGQLMNWNQDFVGLWTHPNIWDVPQPVWSFFHTSSAERLDMRDGQFVIEDDYEH